MIDRTELILHKVFADYKHYQLDIDEIRFLRRGYFEKSLRWYYWFGNR